MRLPFISQKKKPEDRWLLLDVENDAVRFGIGVQRGGMSHITHCGEGDIEGDWESGLEGFLDSFQKEYISPKRAIVSLPSSISKASSIKQKVLRGDGGKVINHRKAEEILNNVIQMAGKKIVFQIAEDTGIPPSEWIFLRLAIMRISIDGYETTSLIGSNALEMEFSVFGTLCLKSAQSSLEKMCNGANIIVDRVVDEAETVDALGQDGLYINAQKDGTRLFLVQNGSIAETTHIRSESVRKAIGTWDRPESVFVYGKDMAQESSYTSLFPEHIVDMLPPVIAQQKHFTPLALLYYGSS